MTTSLSKRGRAWANALIPAASILAVLALLAVVTREHWSVGEVRFEGNRRATPEALRHLVDVPAGTPLWRVSKGRVERKAEQHPWVSSAEARMAWPGAVVVSVTEREPVALVLYDGLYYADSTGEVFLQARGDYLNYPVITGISSDMEQMHPELPRAALREALSLLEQLEARALVPAEQVSEVHYDGVVGYTVQLLTGGKILFGLHHRERQLERLEKLVQSGVHLDAPLSIDLGPEQVAVVTPLPSPPISR